MRRVLVVDDDPAILKISGEVLKRAGFEVRTASSGAGSVRIAHLWKPHVAVVDVMMPKKGGVETILEMRQDNQDLRIIIITGKVPEDGGILEQLADSFGSGKVLYKPVRRADLVAAVKELSGES